LKLASLGLNLDSRAFQPLVEVLTLILQGMSRRYAFYGLVKRLHTWIQVGDLYRVDLLGGLGTDEVEWVQVAWRK